MKTIILILVAAFATCSTFAQKSKIKSDSSASISIKQKYTCAMHPEIISDHPGKCPKCKKDLTLSSKEKMKMEVMKIYTCTMHPDGTSDKPGKCPKCGMDLTEAKH